MTIKNEEAKQNAIRVAWVNLVGYENFGKLRIDENGYSDYRCRQYIKKDFWECLSDKLKPFKTKEPSGNYLLYRPKSLNGIEDNNGWHRIFNANNLPDSAGYYLFLVDWLEVKGWYEVGVIFPGSYTHWREIVEIPKPLY